MENLQAYLNSPEVLSQFVSNRFFLILFVIVLTSLKHSAYSSIWMTTFINLTGTVLHEFAHFIVGLLLNAKPVEFSLFPQKKKGYYVTGHVSFSNLRFYNSLPTAMAPLSLLGLAYLLDKHFFELVKLNFITYIVYVFLLTVIIENAMPSRADFRQGFCYISGVLLYIGLAVLLIILQF